MKVTVFKCDICDRETDPDEMLHTASGKDICTDCLTLLVDKHFEKEEEPKEVNKNRNEKGWPVAREINEEELSEIINKWKTGVGKNQICKDHHIRIDRLNKIIGDIPRDVMPRTVADFDWGKAQALRDAGWPISKIAKEIKCSEQSVYNHTHVPEKKEKKKPHEWVDVDIARMGETDKSYFEEATADGSD